jgi:hypothetical protein
MREGKSRERVAKGECVHKAHSNSQMPRKRERGLRDMRIKGTSLMSDRTKGGRHDPRDTVSTGNTSGCGDGESTWQRMKKNRNLESEGFGATHDQIDGILKG